jgi:hypothetical protein
MCQGCVYLQSTLQGPAIAAFDPTGVIVAVGLSTARVILLYDIANMHKGPFQRFAIENVDHPRNYDWTSLKFSPDGSYILICTNGLEMCLIEAFRGRVMGWVRGFENKGRHKLEGGFTGDCKYIYCGKCNAHNPLRYTVFLADLASCAYRLTGWKTAFLGRTWSQKSSHNRFTTYRCDASCSIQSKVSHNGQRRFSVSKYTIMVEKRNGWKRRTTSVKP